MYIYIYICLYIYIYEILKILLNTYLVFGSEDCGEKENKEIDKTFEDLITYLHHQMYIIRIDGYI